MSCEGANIKDYGAVGTVNPANEAADTAALLAARAASDRVCIPPGDYYFSTTADIGAHQSLVGAGEGITRIHYSGSGNAVYMGAPGSTQLIYNCELRDMSIHCTNRAATVNGVYLDNCVYFNVQNLTVIGSGSPNSSTPADRVLYGAGLMLSNNTIIGRVSKVSCRIWNMGYYFKTLSGSQSFWTAAIQVDGEGELGNNMAGIVVGDGAIPYYTAVGVTFANLCIQGNYTVGVQINTGDNTVFDNVYCEGNANYDFLVGSTLGAPAPIGIKIINCPMNSESIGTTPYGNFPYLAKVKVVAGIGTIVESNNMSISTAIPLVSIAAAAETTMVKQNRLNSTAASNARIANASATTVTADNYPEAPRVKVGSFTRLLSGATGHVSYTGLGFRPTSIEFTAAVDTSNEFCMGFADAQAGRCLTSDSASSKVSSGDCIRIIRVGGGNEQKAVLVSFDADGFTLAWTLVGAPPANDLVVNYVARR